MEQKGFINALILIGILIIAVLIGKDHLFIKSVNQKLFNYEMVYTKDQKVYIYDLATDTSKEILAKPLDLLILSNTWSNNGIFSFADEGSLFITGPPYQNSRKILSDFMGLSYWKNDSSGIYFAKYFKNGQQIPYIDGVGMKADKSYFVSLDGTEKEISVEEFNKFLLPLTIEEPASFNNSYIVKSIYSQDKNAKVTLISKSTNKTYSLPDDSYRPVISPDNSYLAVKAPPDPEKKDSGDPYPVKIFFLNDVLNGKFDNPILSKEKIYEWEWRDNENILYITAKTENIDNNLGYTYSFNALNIKTKKETVLMPPFTTDQAYMNIHVSPNGKYFVYNLTSQTGKTPSDYKASNEFIIVDSRTGKEIRKFTTDAFNFQWSGPLIIK